MSYNGASQIDEAKMSAVLVTGGSGFIGAHSILQLLAAGHQVKTTVRNLKRESEVRAMLKEGGTDAGDRLSFVAADLESDASWPEAVAGCCASRPGTVSLLIARARTTGACPEVAAGKCADRWLPHIAPSIGRRPRTTVSFRARGPSRSEPARCTASATLGERDDRNHHPRLFALGQWSKCSRFRLMSYRDRVRQEIAGGACRDMSRYQFSSGFSMHVPAKNCANSELKSRGRLADTLISY